MRSASRSGSGRDLVVLGVEVVQQPPDRGRVIGAGRRTGHSGPWPISAAARWRCPSSRAGARASRAGGPAARRGSARGRRSRPSPPTSPGRARARRSQSATASAPGDAGLVELAGLAVREDLGHRVGRVLLVGPDDAAGPALDPADRVLAAAAARPRRPGPGRRRCGSGRALRRTGCRAAAARGSRSSAGPGRTRSSPPRRFATARSEPPEPSSIRLRTTRSPADRLAVAVEDLQRRAQEAHDDAVALALRLARGVVAQDLDVALRGGVGGVGLQPGRAVLVELDLGGVDDDVRARQLAQLAQLGVGERGLRRAAAAEQRRPPRRCACSSASSAWSAVSVGESSSGSSTSIRATSIATLPLPMTTARVAERSNSWSAYSGWPLYQATNSVAACEPGRSSPGMPSRLSSEVPDRVDDGVVALEQVVARDVGAELDAAEEPEARLRRRSSRTSG